jgi:superfamily I DNA/RNA helicase
VPILDAAGRLTGDRLEGTENGGVQLFRFSSPTEKAEAEGIARRIAALVGGTSFFAIDSRTVPGRERNGAEETSPGECAILLRSAALARPIIKALGDHGIPYEFTGEKPWWEEEPAKSLVDLLRRGVFGDAPAPGSAGAPVEPVPSFGGGTPSEAVREAAALLKRGGPAGSPRKKNASAPEGEEIIRRLINAAAFYDDIREFLDILAVSGGEDRGIPETKRDGVRIMTIHASKGREFDHVFIPALEDGLLPFTLFEDNRNIPEDLIAEEQRLLYVAMTRSRRGLYLSRAESRMYGNRTLKLEPSRFLKRLETIVSPGGDEYPKRRNLQRELF